MNALLPPRHYTIRNGSHWVLLCDPSRLANSTSAATVRAAVTCPACLTALSPEDNASMEREIIKRMNDIGKPRR